MKVKLSDILNGKEALENLAKERLPVKTAYRLHKFIEKANREIAIFDKLHIDLVKKYGNQEGETYRVPDERMADFLPDFEELISVEVELEFQPFTIDELGDIRLSVADLDALKFLLE